MAVGGTLRRRLVDGCGVWRMLFDRRVLPSAIVRRRRRRIVGVSVVIVVVGLPGAFVTSRLYLLVVFLPVVRAAVHHHVGDSIIAAAVYLTVIHTYTCTQSINGARTPVCVLVVLEVLMAAVQSI